MLGFRITGATLVALAILPAASGEAQVRTPSAEERVAKARAILENNLVDYSGAKVRGMQVVETTVDAKGKLFLYVPIGTKLTTICGEVNAPNRMGGMTGWTKTAIIVEGRDAEPLVTEEPYLAAYLAACPTGSVGEDVTAALQPAAKPAN